MYRPGRPIRQTIPLNLIVDARAALVVGGGQVARRKTANLLAAGAKVELVSPDAVKELADLAEGGRLVWTRRAWREGDAAGHLVVFACTDDKHVNRAILDDARRAHVPCCCADLNWADGDFTTPAIARLGELTVAVSTSGQNCTTARDARNRVVEALADDGERELVVIGTSDDLLPSRKRAPFHLPAEERAKLGPLVKRIRGVDEFFILNTCNRVELVAIAVRSPDVRVLLNRLAGFDRLAAGERFELAGREAFRHLALVASGLESNLLGEFHVVNQFKEALDEAEANGWSSGALKSAGAEILRISKAIRHEVEGLLRVAEIDQVAVRYLAVHGGMDPHARVAVVGTGMVGTGAVKSLVALGAKVTWLYHRRVPEAMDGVDIRPMDELENALAEVDVVLSAVDASRPVITPAMASALADRDVLLVDLGVPRNVDPFFDDFGRGVAVADLDDLKLWHRVKTGTLKEVLERADAVIATSL